MGERNRWPIIICFVVTLLAASMYLSSGKADILDREIPEQGIPTSGPRRKSTEKNNSETSVTYAPSSGTFISSTALPADEPTAFGPTSPPSPATPHLPLNTTTKRHLPRSPPSAQCLCPAPGKLKEFGPRKRFQRMGNTTENPGCILLLHQIAVTRVDTFHYMLWAESPAELRQVSTIVAACPVVLLTDCVFCPDQFRQVKLEVKRRRVGGRPKAGGVSDTAVLVLHRIWEQGPYHAIVDPGIIPMYVMAETVAENVAVWSSTEFRKGLLKPARGGKVPPIEKIPSLSSLSEPLPDNYTGEYFLHRFHHTGKWKMVVAESFRARSDRQVRWALNDISATLMKPLTVLNRKHARWFQIKKPTPKNETNASKAVNGSGPPELAVRGSREGWFALGQVNWLSFWGWKDAVRTSSEEERLPAHPLTAYEVRRFRRHSLRICHHTYPPGNLTSVTSDQVSTLNNTVVVDLRGLAFVNERLRGIPDEFVEKVIRPNFGALKIQTSPVSLWRLSALETVRLLRENKFYFGSEGAFFSWMLLASDASTWFMLHPTVRPQREWRPVSYHMTFARYLNGPSLVAFDVPYNSTPSTPSPSTAQATDMGPLPQSTPTPAAMWETEAFRSIGFPPASFVREIIQSFLGISQSMHTSSSSTSSFPSSTIFPPMVSPINAMVAGLPATPPPVCQGRFLIVRVDLNANQNHNKRLINGNVIDESPESDSKTSNSTTAWESVWLAPVFCVWGKS